MHPFHTPQQSSGTTSMLKRAADEARQRMEAELHGLAALERELDRLDRQLSDLRAQLARSTSDQS